MGGGLGIRLPVCAVSVVEPWGRMMPNLGSVRQESPGKTSIFRGGGRESADARIAQRKDAIAFWREVCAFTRANPRVVDYNETVREIGAAIAQRCASRGISGRSPASPTCARSCAECISAEGRRPRPQAPRPRADDDRSRAAHRPLVARAALSLRLPRRGAAPR